MTLQPSLQFQQTVAHFYIKQSFHFISNDYLFTVVGEKLRVAFCNFTSISDEYFRLAAKTPDPILLLALLPPELYPWEIINNTNLVR